MPMPMVGHGKEEGEGGEAIGELAGRGWLAAECRHLLLEPRLLCGRLCLRERLQSRRLMRESIDSQRVDKRPPLFTGRGPTGGTASSHWRPQREGKAG